MLTIKGKKFQQISSPYGPTYETISTKKNTNSMKPVDEISGFKSTYILTEKIEENNYTKKNLEDKVMTLKRERNLLNGKDKV